MHRLAVSKIFVDWYSESVLAKKKYKDPACLEKYMYLLNQDPIQHTYHNRLEPVTIN